MRELNLLDTGCMASLLLLSLVLPLMLSLTRSKDAVDRKNGLRTVWAGQVLGALCGLVILLSGPAAPYAFAAGVAGCFACVFILRLQLRTAPIA